MRAVLLAAVLIAAVVAATLASSGRRESRADIDPGSAPVVTDWVEITKLAITKDFDDGDAELCVQFVWNHPGHKVDDGSGPEWLKFDCWEDVETEDATAANPVVLIGEGGLAKWNSPTHRECLATAAWEMRFRVTELDGNTTLAGILKTISKALQDKKITADPTAVIAGAALGVVAEILGAIFAESTENVGTGSENFAGGAGDPGPSRTTKKANLANFSYEVTKVVEPEPAQEPNPCTTPRPATPTPSPTEREPTPTPPCIPSEDPGCCEDFPDTPG